MNFLQIASRVASRQYAVGDDLVKKFLDHIGHVPRADESPADAFERLRKENPDVLPVPKQGQSLWDAIREVVS